MTVLSQEQHATSLEAMTSQKFDALAVDGGIAGAGIAFDAATRGLNTVIVDAQNWVAGTSSRSSRLVHGGFRYLYDLDFKLVAGTLREHGQLLIMIALHLVEAQFFLWPLKTPVIEYAYSAVSVGMYDTLARIGFKGHKTVPIQRHLGKAGVMRRFPEIKHNALVGATEFYDARVGDARLVITLIRTAVKYGTAATNHIKVTEALKDGRSRACGVETVDLESGNEFTIEAGRVIDTTDVWTEQTQKFTGDTGGLKVFTSKGIHIVIPRERLKATTDLFLYVERSVLFIIPWQHYWVISTTNTAWHEQLKHPVPASEDIDYMLDHANEVLDLLLARNNTISTCAGLQPLLQPKVFDELELTKVSREHTVTEVIPGMMAIAGGKPTTYRVMAEDAVSFTPGQSLVRARSSVAAQLPLLGAEGFDAVGNQIRRLDVKYGLDADRLHHLVCRCNSELLDLLAVIGENPSPDKPLEAAPRFLRVEAHRACTVEGALHLEDILVSRVRFNSEAHDRGGVAVDEAAEITAVVLGWDEARLEQEESNYRERIVAKLAAEEQPTDATASATRMIAEDIVG